MITRKTWSEFRNAGLLWWVNRILHLCGWAIVVVQEEDGSISEVYPARVRFRGFHEESESEGFYKITHYLNEHMDELIEEVKE